MEQSFPRRRAKTRTPGQMTSRLQSVPQAASLIQEHCKIPLSLEPEPDMTRLAVIFEKRHPITHNLGVVDKKYLEKMRSPERLGKEVSINEEEIIWAADMAFWIIDSLHSRLFRPAEEAKI
jgi:hypothetical protein